MCKIENVELPPLHAAEYRRLWLDREHELGLIAETLAEVLGWQPTGGELIPDALALAEAAAARIVALEQPTRRSSRASTRQPMSFALN